ncbi:transposon Tf2-9 polyprotein [Trichonephila inaurata madagascariensis]|uniref:Transposon Tf2-9 polyprotein n=1 Tax=Trichonephila inaurata madagascariensis TaxID=2747483 RepID=A0A8X6KJB1_9ARAC|nr:transposon Tf2-9 polyprotein [Trichonephila inaurata madagascariensis]
MCLADGQQSTSLVQKATVPITVGLRTFHIDLIFWPHAKGNRTLLGVDFLKISGIVMDMRNNFWYFCDKPSFRIPFSKDVPLPVDDSPVEINSSVCVCPTNSIPSEVPLHSNTVDETETNDLHLREGGQALNVEERNDVDATPETDSSAKPEANASVMPNDRESGSKDIRIGSGNEPRSKDVRCVGRTKNDRYGYNKQSRGNSIRNSSYRGNQRFNIYPKPNEQRFNRFKNRGGYYPERFDVEKHYTEGDYLPQNKADSEDYFFEARHDTSTVTDLSPRPRSYSPSNKWNERTNYYHSNRKHDGEKKGNFYHRSNSDTRGRSCAPNSHEKYNNENQNYHDTRRQNYDSEVNNKSDCAQISNESLNEASDSISPSDKECFQNNQPECDDKDESKKQDICAGNSSKGAFFDRQRRNAYRFDTHFQDGRRCSFKKGDKMEGGKFAQENHSGRNYNRRSRGNSYWYSSEENLHYSNDKRVYNRRDEPYIVLSQKSPTTFVVDSCDKPDEPLGVYHTSASTPFLNGTETQSPVVPLKKREGHGNSH